MLLPEIKINGFGKGQGREVYRVERTTELKDAVACNPNI